jgi:hypothetical protein
LKCTTGSARHEGKRRVGWPERVRERKRKKSRRRRREMGNDSVSWEEQNIGSE